MDIERLRETGASLIDEPEHDIPMIPLKEWADFPLRFTVEYPVKDFDAEVGFWATSFGLRFLSLDGKYAICSDEKNSFTFSFQASKEGHDLSYIKIQWFTDDLNAVIGVLKERGIEHQVFFRSANQRYLRTMSPAGITVEVWSGMEYHCP